MHAPTCPVKMPGTLQRPSANCHYVFSSTIFGVWFFTVKQRDQLALCLQFACGTRGHARVAAIRLRFKDMPTRLPFSSLLVPVRQIASRLSPSKLARYPAAIVFLPLKPTPADWAALPHGSVVRDLYVRRVRKEGDSLRLSVGARAETLLIVALRPTIIGHFRAAANGGETRTHRHGVRAAVAAAVEPRVRQGSGRCGAPRDDCSGRSGGVQPRDLQEQTETAHGAHAHRYRAGGKIDRPSIAPSPRPRATTSRAGSPPCRRILWTPRPTAACSRISRSICA